MFNFKLFIKVKFRAFGITFGELQKKFSVSYGAGFHYSEINDEVPVDAVKILDQRGVVVKLWV
jgi:hypothetical protein